MKKVLFFSLMIFSIFTFAQDVKMKKGIISVDGKEWAKYDGCGMFDENCSILKGDNEIAFVHNEVNDPSLASRYRTNTTVTWSEVKFLGLNMVFEESETPKNLVKKLYKGQVFDEDGKFNEEKIARLIEKIGTPYSKKYFSNNGQTVIINNNTTSERPRNGVNISIGR